MCAKQFTFSVTNMIRTLVLICVVATSALGLRTPNLKVRYDMSTSGIGTTAFIEMPKSSDSAAASGWVQKTPPELHEGLASLTMWCPKDDYSECVFFDDTGYIAGLQIAFNKERISNIVYDLSVQGHRNWTTTLNGITKNYYTIQQYYISSEILATDPAARIAARNSSIFLQHGGVWVSGINGVLYKISSTASVITGSDSIFTKQACTDKMGIHYYYNMTTGLECSGENFFPWFLLVLDDELIGLGFNLFAGYTVDSSKDWFEHSAELIVRNTVPNGPDCLYELARIGGLVTQHIYFIDTPYNVTCPK